MAVSDSNLIVRNVNVICLPTEHQRDLYELVQGDREFQIELEFGDVGLCGGREIGVPGDKPLGARTRINNKLNPRIMPSLGIL